MPFIGSAGNRTTSACNFISTKHPIGPCSKRAWKIRYAPKATAWPNCGTYCWEPRKPVSFRELYPVRFPWLNSTQETAVNKVLCARDIAIVHGPPGTGKTTTLVEAIYETLHREPQVLVCAQSNTAVDWISEKLVDRGVNVLRIGNPTRVNDSALLTYERRFENHPLYPELWSIRKNLRELGSRARRGSYDEREGVRSRMSRLRDRATALEIQINSELFDGAHVIASTLVSSNHRLLNGRRFGTLFIDEAAQAA